MILSRDQLQRGATDGGFQVESYEKVCVLIDLLEAIRGHPFLGHRMALKGGTALNLFVFDFLDIALAHMAYRTGEKASSSTRGIQQDFTRVGIKAIHHKGGNCSGCVILARISSARPAPDQSPTISPYELLCSQVQK